MKAKDRAQGKWPSVLAQLGIPAEYLDGRHHPCPNGQGEDRFRFADRNGSGNFFCQCSQGEKGGMALVMCCKGLDYASAAKEVERVVDGASEAKVKLKRDPRVQLNRIRERLRPAGDAVAAYLSARGLTVAPGLKQARLTYWHDGASLGTFDAMVGLILSPSNRPQSYHITYLEGRSKAAVPVQRKVMPPIDTITGAAIRLYPAAARMGVAEGIETAIAAHMLTGLPVWSAINSGGIEAFQPPAKCEHLTVFGDNDTSFTGQAAAYVLAKRLARSGIACDVQMPPAGDWNDELLRRAA
jgi:putative DNA primase/helicase